MIILELLPCQRLHCIVGIFKILSKKVFSEDSFVQKPGGVDRNVFQIPIVVLLCMMGKHGGHFIAQPPQRAHHMEARC